MDSSRELLQLIEKKLDRILEETNDLKLRMSLVEQRLTIFDARLDRMHVRMERIDQKFEQNEIKPTSAPAEFAPRPVQTSSNSSIPRAAPIPTDDTPHPAKAPVNEREQEDKWFEDHLQQRLNDERRYRSDEPQLVPHRASFTRFDRS